MHDILTLLRRFVMDVYIIEGRPHKVNHLIFMDDLKLFATSEDQIDTLVSAEDEFSKDIGMELGIKNREVLIMKRRKMMGWNWI